MKRLLFFLLAFGCSTISFSQMRIMMGNQNSVKYDTLDNHMPKSGN